MDSAGVPKESTLYVSLLLPLCLALFVSTTRLPSVEVVHHWVSLGKQKRKLQPLLLLRVSGWSKSVRSKPKLESMHILIKAMF